MFSAMPIFQSVPSSSLMRSFLSQLFIDFIFFIYVFCFSSYPHLTKVLKQLRSVYMRYLKAVKTMCVLYQGKNDKLKKERFRPYLTSLENFSVSNKEKLENVERNPQQNVFLQSLLRKSCACCSLLYKLTVRE